MDVRRAAGAGVGGTAGSGGAGRGAARLLALVLGLALAVLALAVLEASLSAAGWREHAADFRLPGNHAAAFDESGRFVRDPERYFTTGPDWRASPTHAGRFATGPWPFRGRPAVPAPAGIVRVAVLGDSCVYGESVPVSDSLPEGIQGALAERGFPREALQVLNFGVSGYSTVQIRLCLEDVLGRFAPEVVVLYPAAWNDQAPSLGASDLEVLGEARGSWLARLLPATANALGAALGSRAPRSFEGDEERILEALEKGEPRVAEGEVGRQVTRMLEACHAAGAAPVVMLPAHPARTLEEFPRTALDRETVRAAAEAAGAPVVDVRSVFGTVDVSEDALFLDGVHPSPLGYGLAAAAAADAVAPLLPEAARSAPAAPFRVVSVEPSELSSLGDEAVVVTLAGDGDGPPFPPGGEPPVVLLGGAPLLDVVVDGRGRLVGRTMANGGASGQVNGAVALSLLVQAATGCASADAPVRVLGPRIVAGPDATTLVLRARPHDLAKAVWSTSILPSPRWRPEGPQVVADDFRPLFEGRRELDGEGVLELPLPPELVSAGTAWLQPVVDVLADDGTLVDSYAGEAYAWRAPR